jgi:hypothetical protein
LKHVKAEEERVSGRGAGEEREIVPALKFPRQ